MNSDAEAHTHFEDPQLEKALAYLQRAKDENKAPTSYPEFVALPVKIRIAAAEIMEGTKE